MLDRGTNVAGYRVDGVLGEGGMGVVYRATQLSLNRVVALKVLAPELSDDPDFRTRFQREGQLQAALDHHHIVSVYEAGRTEHGLFLAMRLIPGPTLKDLILGGQLDTRRSLRLLAQVAQALDAAHEAGLIHRDIKPQNILIGKDDHAYLADFGLTKAPDDATRLTGTGQFIGTIDYVAPEQIQGEPASAASDCYSLTAVLYECLTGEVPYPRPDETATLHAHLTVPPPQVSEHRPELPPGLDEVIATGMAKDPTSRPSSSRELIAMATRAAASATPVATPAQETRLTGAPVASPAQVTRAGGIVTVPSAAPSVAAIPPAPATATAPPTAPRETAVEPPSETPPAPAAPAPPRSEPRRGSPAVLGAFVVLVLAAIVAGFLIGHSGKSTSSASFASSVTVGHLQLHYPSGWAIGSHPNVPGVSFTDPIVLYPPRAGNAQLAGGEVATIGPTLLPATLRARIRGALPPPQAVSLGGLEAYRYAGLQVSGASGPVTVYAVPTSDGVAIVACSGPSASSFLSQCDEVAATLRLLGTSAYQLGPSPTYGRELSHTFGVLHSQTSGPLARLQSASTPAAQATAAGGLAAAYAAAASALARVSISPQAQGSNATIVAALRGLASGYSRAAGAAATGNTASYTRAESQIRSASTALSNGLHKLSELGYTVG